jgi:uncharacterized integral membrane protein
MMFTTALTRSERVVNRSISTLTWIAMWGVAILLVLAAIFYIGTRTAEDNIEPCVYHPSGVHIPGCEE